MGLVRKRGPRKGSWGFASQVDPEWFRKMVTEVGMSYADVARAYEVTRERVRQVAGEFGIEQSKRTPRWYAARLGMPKLGSKKWLEERLRKMPLVNLARESGKTARVLRSQAERLGVNVSHIARERDQAVWVYVSCTYCGKVLVRRKSSIRPNQDIFFCDRTHHGKWLAAHFGLPFTKNGDWREEFEKRSDQRAKRLLLIATNWRRLSDREMSRRLKVSPNYVKHMRLNSGFSRRPRGRTRG